MVNDYPRGSEWRKWDLHVHTPFSYQNNFSDWDTFVTTLKEKAVEHDIEAVGINDYFSIQGYKELLSQCPEETRYTTPYIELTYGKKLYLFPMVELRLDNFTSDNTAVNIHVIFSPDILPDTIRSDFLENLTFSYQGEEHNYKHDNLIKVGHAEKCDGRYDTNLDLNQMSDDKKRKLTDIALQIITIPGASFKDSTEKFKEMLKKSKIKSDKYLIIIANKGHGGLSDFKWFDEFKNLSRSGNVRQSLLNIADICFSNSSSDINFLLGKEKSAPREEVINRFGSCKPCIWGSDAHSEETLFHPSDGKTLDYTWIKADPTFEGLKQIIYEPEDGERVHIGPSRPDQKFGLNIISKIRFENSQDFPSEIEFNGNLSAIIGSRASGKSALLAYLAHAIDPDRTEELKLGPGEGENYRWDCIQEQYSVEWANGKSNHESPGQVVYIPQNHLFIKSTNRDEIKLKIKPVLSRKFPAFHTKYEQTEGGIKSSKQEVEQQVHQWFDLSDQLISIKNHLKNLGDTQAIEQEKASVESKIMALRERYSLSESDLTHYRNIHNEIASYKNRITQIDLELVKFASVSDQNGYFDKLYYSTSPTIEDLPDKVREEIRAKINEMGSELTIFANRKVFEYKQEIIKERANAESHIQRIQLVNSELIERYQVNLELHNLVKKLSQLESSLNGIKEAETTKAAVEKRIQDCVNRIEVAIQRREELISDLIDEMMTVEQGGLMGIKFGIDRGDPEDLTEVVNKINVRENTAFVKSRELQTKTIQDYPDAFLRDIYLGTQKINAGNDNRRVAIDVLNLTDDIVFMAEMEGDRIGGFSESTMTPGKRALFLLKLILIESDDKWPLLIDQPEDDLDSRSIYNDIVPFIKECKKERQIIMVSHNANFVIGSDSEQVIVANRHGSDRQNDDEKQFNYLTGSLEHTQPKDPSCPDTLKSQGIREHTCEILEGGEVAFESRKNKYNIK